MAFFSYKAVDADGVIVKGSLEAPDIDFVRENIESSGKYVIAIRRSSEYVASLRRRLQVRDITNADIIEFANNLSVMLSAGIPIITALNDIAAALKKKHLRRTIDSVRAKVELGSGFSRALSEHPDVFPDILVQLTSVGEETGGLDQSLSDVASHLQRMEDLMAAVKRALIYPVFAIVSTFGALLFWLVYVLPKVLVLFKDTGMALPLPTRMLLFLSSFTRSYWHILVAAPVLAVFLVVTLYRKNTAARYYMDLALIRAPIIKHIAYNKLLALLSEQLRILTRAGITINRTLAIATDVIGNEVFRRALSGSIEEISVGSRISDAMRKFTVFPPLLVRMVDIGETTGSLDDQFEYLSGYYLKNFDDMSQKLGKMIEPLVIGVIGLMFIFIILGLMLPVYDLVGKVG